MNRLLTILIPALLWSGANQANTQPGETDSGNHASGYENQLITSLRDIQEQRVDGALEKIGALVEENPKFKLAQLIYADLLLAKAGPITDFGNGFATPDELTALKSEVQQRWQHHSSHPGEGYIPSNLMQLAPEVKHAVAIDLSKSRLYLYEHNNGELNLVTDYYVSIGKNGAIKEVEGDKKTPIGVYHITSFLAPETLPDFYGAGAFPINYPNAIDKLRGKTGYGIWLHGTPTDTYSRPPRASDGCVTLSNSDLEAIKPLLQNGHIPVVIAEELEWVEQATIAKQEQRFNETLERWRQDWQSRDSERYLSHYSLDFRNKKMDYASWALRKRHINSQKRFIEVELEGVNVFNYPGETDLRIVNFTQKYRSDDYQQTSRKQQYWKQEEDGAWRIIYEGPA